MYSIGTEQIRQARDDPRAGDRTYPLSFAQERLWFLDRLEGGSPFYNIPRALRISGNVDVDVLKRSIGEIIQRHSVLRARFREIEGFPVQVIGPCPARVLAIDDLSALGEHEREAAAIQRATQELARPFDLAKGPPFRGRLLRLSRTDHVLLLTVHHIVSDGWSMRVLLRELGLLYQAYREGRGSPLPELSLQYGDYAVWQRQHISDEVLARDLDYWREELSGAPSLQKLPTDRPRPAVQSYPGARESMNLSVDLLDRLKALGGREGATLYMVLLSVFQLLLSKYSGYEDVVVGSPIAGRVRRDVEDLIGCFANTLVLRADLGGDPSFRQLLRRVRERTIGAYAHQEVPFEKLVAELQPERTLNHSPIYQVIFALETSSESLQLGDHTVAPFEIPRSFSQTDLSVLISRSESYARLVAHYNTDLFERSTIQRMLGHMTRLLEQAAEKADRRLSELKVLLDSERERVLAEWNRVEAEYPSERCVHELFEAQVARRPDAVAVVFEREALSYRELNGRANRLAHHLRALGVGPDARVGICVEPGLEMVVGVLAVLKAGGAYVPLDPSYPGERLDRKSVV